MIVHYFSDNFGRHGFRAEPEEYDAHPRFSELLLDAKPQLLNPARLSAAAFLAFYRNSSGGMTLPGLALPLTAQWMEKIAKPAWVNISPIEYAPKDVPKGTLRLDVSLQNTLNEPIVVNKSRILEGVEMSILPSGTYRGAIFGHNKLAISSNAWLFSGDRNDEKKVCAILSIAILFSEDMHINHINIIECNNIGELFRANITGFMKSVGLSIGFDEIPEVLK